MYILLSEIASGVGIVVGDETVLELVPDTVLESFASLTGTNGVDVVVGTTGTGLPSATVSEAFGTVEGWVTLGAAGELVVVGAGAALFRGTPVHRFPPILVILNPACRGTL